jgi:predicted RNA methylase
MVRAGLIEQGQDEEQFVPCADLADRRYAAGYLSWALDANRPYIDHAAEFVRDPAAAGEQWRRDGRRVAVSSRWIGSFGFYPGVFSEIVSRRPRRIVDLGAGAAALLIGLLTEIPAAEGVAVDISPAACEEAERAARAAGVDDRLTVLNRSIESLVDDADPLRGADVVHAGFVMHDVRSDPVVLDGILRRCRESVADGGCLIVTDAVGYSADPRERAFSALFSYLHESAMNVTLPNERDWCEDLERAGFATVSSMPLRMPGSRLFVANA